MRVRDCYLEQVGDQVIILARVVENGLLRGFVLNLGYGHWWISPP